MQVTPIIQFLGTSVSAQIVTVERIRFPLELVVIYIYIAWSLAIDILGRRCGGWNSTSNIFFYCYLWQDLQTECRDLEVGIRDLEILSQDLKIRSQDLEIVISGSRIGSRDLEPQRRWSRNHHFLSRHHEIRSWDKNFEKKRLDVLIQPPYGETSFSDFHVVEGRPPHVPCPSFLFPDLQMPK